MAYELRQVFYCNPHPIGSYLVCRKYRYAPTTPGEYPFRHEAFDLNVVWQASPTQDGILVAGLMQNVRYTQLQDAEVIVQLLDRERKIVTRGRSFTSPNRVEENEWCRFTATLPHGTIARGSLLQFIISYHAIDDASSSFHWVSSFAVEANTGKPVQIH